MGENKDNKMGNKGFVSIRRLGEKIEKDEISKMFPQGRTVTTRVLAFDFMEQVYNCSLERFVPHSCLNLMYKYGIT